MSFVVIRVPGLSMEMLGCYGSPFGLTPNLDRLAAESCVFDQYFASNLSSASLVASLVAPRLAKQFASIGSIPGGVFIHAEESEIEPLVQFSAVSDTALRENLTTTVTEHLGEGLLWLELPELGDDVESELSAIDNQIDDVWALLVDHDDSDWLMVAGARHGPIEIDGGTSLEQALHCPLLIRAPDWDAVSWRTQSLAQSLDLLPTVLDTIGAEVTAPFAGSSLVPLIRHQQLQIHSFVLTQIGPSRHALRTRGWLFVSESGDNPSTLHHKPEDRWNHNNVAREFPAIVQQFEDFLQILLDSEQPQQLPEDLHA